MKCAAKKEFISKLFFANTIYGTTLANVFNFDSDFSKKAFDVLIKR